MIPGNDFHPSFRGGERTVRRNDRQPAGQVSGASMNMHSREVVSKSHMPSAEERA